ncbi:MAG: hypothetical protein JWP29_5681 [Rhodoferax sp.]|nr:hypothetical protein [Rhodoferax sp.]
MIPRAERRHLDDTVRSAVRGAFNELLKPLLDQPDFQKRLAMAIAARMPPAPQPEPEPKREPVPAVKKAPGRKKLLAAIPPAPIDRRDTMGPKSSFTPQQLAEIKAFYLQTKAVRGTARHFGIPTGTMSSLVYGKKWHKLPATGDRPDAEAGAMAEPPQAEISATATTPPAAPDPVVEATPASSAPAPAASMEPEKAALPPPAAARPPAPALPRPAAAARAEPEMQAASTKAVRDWLERSLHHGGLGKLAASDKVAVMTHQEALQEANRRRQLLRLVPFVFLGTRVDA